MIGDGDVQAGIHQVQDDVEDDRILSDHNGSENA